MDYLGEVKQLADLAGPLGSTHAGLLIVGQAGELSLTLLHDLQVQHRQIRGNDAAADRLAATLTCMQNQTRREGRLCSESTCQSQLQITKSLPQCHALPCMECPDVARDRPVREKVPPQAPSDTLTAAATVTPEALLTGAHEQAHALVGQHTLLHAKALLVVSTHDLEDVALCPISGDISRRACCRARGGFDLP